MLKVRYTYRRGLLRCSFNYDGQCEASERGTSDGKTPTLFSYKLLYTIRLLTRELKGVSFYEKLKACLQII